MIILPNNQILNESDFTSLNKKSEQTARNHGLDLVRVTAILFVIAGHFFINTPAHEAEFKGISMFLQGMGRTLFLTNVPLFLILTGYLNLNKTISKAYYKKMGAVLLSYIFISVVTIFFLIYFNHEHRSIIGWILGITDFSVINYSWYIEMWIGLFLLTPFLNILWQNLSSLRHKHILLLTLYGLCALPDMFNRYGVHLVPGYWELVYPCAFYFIGAYMKETQLNPNKIKLLLFILLCMLINPVFNILFVKNHSMIQLAGDGNGVIGMPLSAAVFLILYNVNINGSLFKNALTSISRVSLDMYLASYMFDVVNYDLFKRQFFSDQSQFGLYFFIIVPIIFIESYLFSLFKQRLFILLHLPSK